MGRGSLVAVQVALVVFLALSLAWRVAILHSAAPWRHHHPARTRSPPTTLPAPATPGATVTSSDAEVTTNVRSVAVHMRSSVESSTTAVSVSS